SFSGTAARPLACCPTRRSSDLPSGATSGPVIVTASGLASNGVSFTVTVPPTIATLSPASGPVGTAITIAGTNFGATPGMIVFNGTPATPTSWSDTSITAAVTSDAKGGRVAVTVGGAGSNGANFTVSLPAAIRA